MSMVIKVVWWGILPKMKSESLSKGLQEPVNRVFEKPNYPYYIIIENLEWISGHSYVMNAIY